MLTLNNLKLRVGEDEKTLVKLCEKKLHAPCAHFRILRKSLDARDKSDIRWVYSVECDDKPHSAPPKIFPKVKGDIPPVVIVGTGPCGLFCALRLVEYGIKPVLLERGKAVEERLADLKKFREERIFDPESNVQFGEGGAGTFSDGKLNTQTNGSYNRDVIDGFLRFGAPQEIGYLNKPHIGSDKLVSVLAAMRAYLVEHGAEFRFSSKLTDLEIKNGAVSGVFVNGVREDAGIVVLAIGHSARDTFEVLHARGLRIEQKEFAVGVRIEHLQEKISLASYGKAYKLLPPADYKLVSHASERGVFTFCMCPGGHVVAAASEAGGVVVNGMSDYARDGVNSNAALVAQVLKSDFGGEHPLAGVEFQRKMERAAYAAAGGGYAAPVQLVGDFLSGRNSSAFGEVKPTYPCGTAFAPVDSYLPEGVVSALRLALPDMERRLRGFASPDAVLTGVESRTSSPVRIVRDETYESNIGNIYPCGEGCGYAGGITSAASDGLRIADAIAQRYL